MTERATNLWGTQSSMNDFSLVSARSHCSETKSMYSLISSSGVGSNSNKLSRPAWTLCTIPTLSKTRRCLVIACRVSLEPCVNWEIEEGCPPESFTTKDNRVASPNAAKTGACALPLAARLLRCFCNISLNVLHLFSPTTLIPAEGFKTKVAGDILETRLCEYKQRAGCSLLQPEFDKRGGECCLVSLCVIRLVQRFRMRPGEGK